MELFTKSRKLDHVSYDVRGPALDEADYMHSQGIEILKLNVGNPATFGFNAPADIREVMAGHLSNADGYSDSKGIISAREAIAAYCGKKGISGVTPGDVYTGNGVSELIVMCMQGLLDSGDEILVPAPDYPLWTAAITLAGGTAVHYICDEQSDWLPDLEDIKRKVSPHTKGIVVINPNNPTGALYPTELLNGIADIARENGLIIFADEIYDRLVMDGHEHVSIASLAPDVFCITMNGLSKSHRAAGYRVGWMSLSGDKRKAAGYIEGLNMLSSMRLCSNVPAQYIIPMALENSGPDLDILPGGRIYEQREYIYEAMNRIPGISAVKPKAAFYIFPKIDIARFNITDDEKFVLDFLREKHVLLVRGKGFNWHEPDHFRIVFLPEMDVLKRASKQLECFLSEYTQN